MLGFESSGIRQYSFANKNERNSGQSNYPNLYTPSDKAEQARKAIRRTVFLFPVSAPADGLKRLAASALDKDVLGSAAFPTSLCWLAWLQRLGRS